MIIRPTCLHIFKISLTKVSKMMPSLLRTVSICPHFKHTIPLPSYTPLTKCTVSLYSAFIPLYFCILLPHPGMAQFFTHHHSKFSSCLYALLELFISSMRFSSLYYKSYLPIKGIVFYSLLNSIFLFSGPGIQ